MNKSGRFLVYIGFVLLLAMLSQTQAQSQDGMKPLFDSQFNYAARILDLAEAMPAESYDWRPEEGVRSVGEVYTHIIQANYMILGSLGVSMPEGVDVQAIGALTEKDDIVQDMDESISFVLSAVEDLPEEKLTESVELFGRSTKSTGVLICIHSHMSELPASRSLLHF